MAKIWVELPRYNYQLARLSVDFNNEPLKVEVNKPDLPKTVEISSLVHESNNRLTIFINAGKKVSELPLYIKHKEDDLDKIKVSGKSFLYMNETDFHDQNEYFGVHWGFNAKADIYQKAYNQKVAALKVDYQKRLSDVACKKELQVLSILSEIEKHESKLNPGDYFPSRNKAKIEAKALELISQLRDINVPNQTIQSMYVPDVDPNCIFGVQPNVWQTFIIHYVLTCGNLEDISMVNKYLIKNGISIVEPYKTAFSKSKLFKEVEIELPFKTPYRVIIDYRKRTQYWFNKLCFQRAVIGSPIKIRYIDA